MSVPYHNVVTFDVEPCQFMWIELPTSQRGVIGSICLRPTENIEGNQNAMFAVYCKDLSEIVGSLDSNPSCTFDSEQLEAIAPIYYDSVLYQVTPFLTTNNGGVYQGFEKNYMFCNADGTPTNPVKKLYLGFMSICETRSWQISYTYSTPTF